MLEQAKTKIRTEMEQNKDDSYIQVIGKYLLQHLDKHPEDAEKVAAEDKHISKSIEAMAAEAKKKQKNGRAMLTDEEGYAIVLKYFGIETAAPAPAAPEASAFNVSLEDFMPGEN